MTDKAQKLTMLAVLALLILTYIYTLVLPRKPVDEEAIVAPDDTVIYWGLTHCRMMINDTIFVIDTSIKKEDCK